MTRIKLTKGFRITDEALRAMIEDRVPGEIPADAVLTGVDHDVDTGVTFVGFEKYVDPEADPTDIDYGTMKVTGQGAPKPSFYLGEDGAQS